MTSDKAYSTITINQDITGLITNILLDNKQPTNRLIIDTTTKIKPLYYLIDHNQQHIIEELKLTDESSSKHLFAYQSVKIHNPYNLQPIHYQHKQGYYIEPQFLHNRLRQMLANRPNIHYLQSSQITHMNCNSSNANIVAANNIYNAKCIIMTEENSSKYNFQMPAKSFIGGHQVTISTNIRIKIPEQTICHIFNQPKLKARLIPLKQPDLYHLDICCTPHIANMFINNSTSSLKKHLNLSQAEVLDTWNTTAAQGCYIRPEVNKYRFIAIADAYKTTNISSHRNFELEDCLKIINSDSPKQLGSFASIKAINRRRNFDWLKQKIIHSSIKHGTAKPHNNLDLVLKNTLIKQVNKKILNMQQ